MRLADKIIQLRKRNGWSQEEMAEKMQVSRQAVSKWESGQTTPDLDKILMLGSLFGVTTDYLLKDELEDDPLPEENGPAEKRVTLAQAAAFLQWRKAAAVRIGVGTFLCIIAVIPLLLLAAAAEDPAYPVSENAAAGIGLIALFVLVTIAVALFLFCGFKNAPYAFIDKDPFAVEYGVAELVKERQRNYKPMYSICNGVGVCICVLSPIPLFIGVFTENEFLIVVLLTVTIFLAGIGVFLFILAGVPWASMQKLLQVGEYAPQKQKTKRVKQVISSVYWLTAVAVYLAWSFWTKDWDRTWVVWPVAGVLFAGVMCLCNFVIDRKK